MARTEHSVGAGVPSYLRGYEGLYASDPKQAALAWFRDAKFGLFLHYGLYSQLARGEWVMFHEKIPVAEYEKLKETFTAENFDVDAIADLAVEAGMKYINLTTRHHDGFSLFKTSASDYNSLNSPAKRDLVGELAEACRNRGLGFFLYYSYAADWHHPYFVSRERGFHFARPAYEHPEPRYKFARDEEFRIYVDFMHAQLRELLTQYGPVAGIWLDPIMGYYYCHDLFPIDETYALIRSLQPQALIAFKQGASGDEDFASPEHSAGDLVGKLRARNAPEHVIEVATRAWERNKDNPRNEICTTLQPKGWSWVDVPDEQRRTADHVMQMLAKAEGSNCNLLLNTGPRPDGTIHAFDAATFREVGRRIRRDGFPAPLKDDGGAGEVDTAALAQ